MRAYKWALLVVRPWQILSSLNHFFLCLVYDLKQ